MPSLLCLSPTLLDQSFPRTIDDARRVAASLGEIELCLGEDQARLVITESLCEIIEVFEWDRPDIDETYPILFEIYRSLTLWFLGPNENIVHVRIADTVDSIPHCIPNGSEAQGLVDDWAKEVGKLYAVHESVRKKGEFFIGIACDYAFAGEEINVYCADDREDCFPLIGPESVTSLTDAYEPVLPNGINRASVSFHDAYNNCKILGAIDIEPPSGGSHYKVIFSGSRPWALDKNTDPLPERFLKQLIPITGYSLEVIKYILTTGELPEYKIRLSKYCV